MVTVSYTHLDVYKRQDEHDLKCPKCGAHNFTDIRQFNLMFKTFQGVLEDAKTVSYTHLLMNSVMWIWLLR